MRYSRNEALFGAEGQGAIGRTAVGIVGTGGLGMHVVQQLAYLGTVTVTAVDDDIVTESSLNRLVGARQDDALGGVKKVKVAERLSKEIQPATRFTAHDGRVQDLEALRLLEGADVIFGCVDDDATRLALTRFSSETKKTYIDLATDIDDKDTSWWGGHIVISDGQHCLVCLGMLDVEQLALAGMTDEQRATRDRVYGVSEDALVATGPMVISINGAVASLAVTEFMAMTTGLRAAHKNLSYRADLQTVTKPADLPTPDCYYCALRNAA